MELNNLQQESYKFFTNLDSFLKNRLSSQKKPVIEKVARVTPAGKEAEGNFIKIFLTPLLKEYFGNQKEGLVVEGIKSQGRTQFKTDFFGSKPAPDFIFTHPIPFNVVGEVKYASLTARKVAIALGQLMIYIKSSELEEDKADYGYMIFFNISLNQDLTETEQQFIKDIWEKENIFVTIL